MAPKPPLTDDEVMAILRLHQRGMRSAEIGPKFNRSRDSIQLIVLGKSYRAVTAREHESGNRECVCLACVMKNRQDANLKIADRAECPVQCQACQVWMSRRVADVLRKHGLVLCDDCDGRRLV